MFHSLRNATSTCSFHTNGFGFATTGVRCRTSRNLPQVLLLPMAYLLLPAHYSYILLLPPTSCPLLPLPTSYLLLPAPCSYPLLPRNVSAGTECVPTPTTPYLACWPPWLEPPSDLTGQDCWPGPFLILWVPQVRPQAPATPPSPPGGDNPDQLTVSGLLRLVSSSWLLPLSLSLRGQAYSLGAHSAGSEQVPASSDCLPVRPHLARLSRHIPEFCPSVCPSFHLYMHHS